MDYWQEHVSAAAHQRTLHNASFRQRARWVVRSIVKHDLFDVVMGCIILLNSVSVGYEMNRQAKEGYGAVPSEEKRLLASAEHVFLAIYIVELLLRFFGIGFWRSLRSGWVRFDVLIVVLGVTLDWLLAPLGIEARAILVLIDMCRIRIFLF